MSETSIILHRSILRRARMAIGYGTLVRHDDDGCEPSPFETMTGVAKRGGVDQLEWQVGEDVRIQTDGQLRAELVDDLELRVGAAIRRFMAGQPVMLQLEGGKIVSAW